MTIVADIIWNRWRYCIKYALIQENQKSTILKHQSLPDAWTSGLVRVFDVWGKIRVATSENIHIFEPAHDKTFKMSCAPSPASAQSDQSLLSAWRKFRSLATHWAHSEDSDQTRQMPRLIRVFTGRTYHFVGFVVRWLILYFLKCASNKDSNQPALQYKGKNII